MNIEKVCTYWSGEVDTEVGERAVRRGLCLRAGNNDDKWQPVRHELD